MSGGIETEIKVVSFKGDRDSSVESPRVTDSSAKGIKTRSVRVSAAGKETSIPEKLSRGGGITSGETRTKELGTG